MKCSLCLRKNSNKIISQQQFKVKEGNSVFHLTHVYLCGRTSTRITPQARSLENPKSQSPCTHGLENRALLEQAAASHEVKLFAVIISSFVSNCFFAVIVSSFVSNFFATRLLAFDPSGIRSKRSCQCQHIHRSACLSEILESFIG